MPRTYKTHLAGGDRRRLQQRKVQCGRKRDHVDWVAVDMNGDVTCRSCKRLTR